MASMRTLSWDANYPRSGIPISTDPSLGTPNLIEKANRILRIRHGFLAWPHDLDFGIEPLTEIYPREHVAFKKCSYVEAFDRYMCRKCEKLRKLRQKSCNMQKCKHLHSLFQQKSRHLFCATAQRLLKRNKNCMRNSIYYSTISGFFCFQEIRIPDYW